MKNFHEQSNVGSAKYVVNYYDGQKTHTDGSAFYDIALFSNRAKKDRFVRVLRDGGYQEAR